MDFPPGDTSYWAAVLAFDDQALGRALATRRPRLAAAGDPTGEFARAWLALMRGEARTLETSVAGLFARAAATRDPSRVIEATVLRAMVALSLGKLADALAFARRASLMARTEALPEAELLANIVLARMRRYAGKPHLAVCILDALARLAPAVTGWLAWERFLAGGIRKDAATPCERTPAAVAVEAAQRLLVAARAGDRATFEREAIEVVRATAGFRDIKDEAQALVALLDPDRPLAEPLLRFQRGESAELGYGLFGTGIFSGDEEPGITIFAVARPRERGKRILREGLGLFGPCRMLSCEEGQRRAHGRTDAALAVLALSGLEPLSEEEFFRRVYGFAYAPAAHRGVLDVLVHRMRKRIGPVGIVARSDGRLSLELEESIAVADPRCSPPAAARILSALARQPLATADAIAGRLGITVRAAQMALQQLVLDGACVVRRTGRHLEYQLQDTTFSEPTGLGFLRPNGLHPAIAK